MDEVKIFLPKLGESILSATIVQWLKAEGDEVEVDEPLLEVSTDKLNSEIPSPVKGRLKKIYAKVDQELAVGDLLAVISTGEKVKTESSKKIKKEEKKEVTKEKKSCLSNVVLKSTKLFLSPVAKVLAEKNGISQEDLDKIIPTGAGGRISRRDIENYLKSSKADVSEATESIKMSSIRKAIAKSMVKASQDIPSASLINEIDVTNVLRLIGDVKDDFFKKKGFKLTITAFLAKAVAKAVQAFPHINATLKDDTIIVKKDVNIGLAVNVENGLIVPVIPNCETKSTSEIAKAIASLGSKARNNKLSLEDIQSGTITISNFGMGGALIGIPIIKHPEAAILGIGTIVKRVVVLEDDSFVVRSIMNVSLTFDHRIIDGMYGCNFMQRLKNYIENEAVGDFS